MNRYSLPKKLPFSKKALPKRVIISYIFDYAIIIILILAFTALDRIEPFHQHFSLRNYTLQYPYAVKERVPVPLLGFLAVLCPLLIIIVYSLLLDGLFSHDASGSGLRRYRVKDRLWEMNCGILGLLLSVAAAVTITSALKNATGKPRPDLIDRCRPKDGAQDALVFGLTNFTICDPARHALWKDGFRSFPSGHSSTAFAGLFYLSLYLAAKLHALDQRGEVWKTVLVLVPTLGAALIADSRIMDARHHPFDVLSGSLLGLLVAWVAYRQYFPPVSDAWKKGRAFPIRSWGREPTHPADPLPQDTSYSHEPLRDVNLHSTALDSNQASYPSTQAGPSSFSSSSNNNNNAFREQIHRSQRQRATYGEAPPPHPSTTMTTATDRDRLPSSSHPHHTQSTHPHQDGYWSSSEDDDTNARLPTHRGPSFELQPQQYGRAPIAHHSPTRESFATRMPPTSYQPASTTFTTVAAPPATAPPSHPTKGVQLVETYATPK